MIAEDGTPCADEDGDVCTPAACIDGECVQDVAPAGCGPLPAAPCQAVVSNPARTFSSLQQAVNGAANGATITVTGLCVGDVLISGRSNLTIQGGPTPSECPAGGLKPGDLSAAVRGRIQVSSSTGIRVRLLAVVEAAAACVTFRSSTRGALDCSCLGSCGFGLDISGGRGTSVSDSLIRTNADDGIVVHRDATDNVIVGNLIEANADDGIDMEDTERNLVADNDVRFNGHDGIDLDGVNESRFLDNRVVRNGCLPTASTDGGIEVRDSDNNEIDGNVILDNPADPGPNEIFCRSGSDGNFGSNVPLDSECR
jgi:parallel beta-helix repeat protein